MALHVVRVSALPDWLDGRRLLGPGDWVVATRTGDRCTYQAELERDAAADLAARLRGVGLAGMKLTIEITPSVPRATVRRARGDEAKRYREGSTGFTRSGARLDPEAKRSLTPEALALQLGEQAGRVHVLDAGCGGGGNAIGFARAGCNVTAIELEPTRLERARHNARLYGVAERIRFLSGDARALVPELDADLLFIDPPWGERYDKTRMTLEQLPLLADLLPQRARFARTWLKVPPSFDLGCVPPVRPQAWFGVGEGDSRRVKFLLLECEQEEPRSAT